MRRPLLLVAIALPLALALACRASAPAAFEVPVRVGYVAMDPRSQSPVVVLEERDGTRLLPIWIGFPEARSIAAQLGDVQSPRPGTHDLAKRLLDQLEGKLERVVVTELADGVYYALLFVRSAGRTIAIDARPSDAIAIALRTHAPVFVREPVFEASEALEEDGLSPGREI